MSDAKKVLAGVILESNGKSSAKTDASFYGGGGVDERISEMGRQKTGVADGDLSWCDF